MGAKNGSGVVFTLVVAFCARISCLPVAAQEPVPTASTSLEGESSGTSLTLEQARGLALGNNRKLGLGRENVFEKQIAACAATKDFFPKILGSAAYLHFNDNLGTVLATSNRQLGGAAIGPGGVIQIPTVTVPGRTIAANVLNQDSAFGMIMAVQPITKLIGVSALVDIARADEEVAAAQLDPGTRALLSGVTQAYYGLLAAGRIDDALSLQIRSIEPLAQMKPTAELRLGLLELRKGRAEWARQFGELADLMNQLIGFPLGTRLALVEPTLPPVVVANADEAAAYALTNNPLIREAQQNIAKADAGITAAKMEFLPDVNVFGGYVGQGAADYIQTNFATVGVTASYMFLDWESGGTSNGSARCS